MPTSIEVAENKGHTNDREDGKRETSSGLPKFLSVEELLRYLESNHQQLEQDSLSIVLQLDEDLNIIQWEQISAQIIELIYSVSKRMRTVSLSYTGTVGRYKITLEPFL